MNIKNSSNESNPFSGIIDFFMTDRNNKLIIQDELTVNGTDNTTSVSNITNNTKIQDKSIGIHLNSTQTSELLPGPSKLKLIITAMDSPKPFIQEHTLIARP
jgi:peptide/nickel transport system substrate-binding protein